MHVSVCLSVSVLHVCVLSSGHVEVRIQVWAFICCVGSKNSTQVTKLSLCIEILPTKWSHWPCLTQCPCSWRWMNRRDLKSGKWKICIWGVGWGGWSNHKYRPWCFLPVSGKPEVLTSVFSLFYNNPFFVSNFCPVSIWPPMATLP